jgi:FemAB-related protein (PEP-CTERM system-associated)
MTPVSVTEWEDGDSWNRYLDGSGSATAYQRFEWRELYRDVFHHAGHYLGAARGEALTGVLPLIRLRTIRGGCMLVSLPYVNYAGLCADDAASAEALWQRAVRLAEETGCCWVELREPDRSPFGLAGLTTRHKVRAYLPLPADAEELWAEFPAKLRSQVRSAWKKGLRERAGGEELLAPFYDVYLRNMRVLGSPPLPAAFFEAIAARFGPQVRICLVADGRLSVAAGFLIGHRSTLEVPWAACRPEYRATAANMLLYWAMIRTAIEAGFGTFDMGRSSAGSGSHRFKEQWGGISRPLEWKYWQKRPACLPSYTHGNGQFALARRVWSRLPLWMTQTLGSRLIRHIPS